VAEVVEVEQALHFGMYQDLLRSQFLDLVGLAELALTVLVLAEMVDRHLLAEAELQVLETVRSVGLQQVSMAVAEVAEERVVLLTSLTHHTEQARQAAQADLELFTFT
jgi:hypothetical protein